MLDDLTVSQSRSVETNIQHQVKLLHLDKIHLQKEKQLNHQAHQEDFIVHLDNIE